MQNTDLEQRMLDGGINRARLGLVRAEERGVITETPAGIAALKQIIRPVTLKIAEWLVETEARVSGKPGRPPHAFRLCASMDPEVLAYLTAKVALDRAAGNKSLTRAAGAVGTAIEDEQRLFAFEQADPGLYGAIDRMLKGRGSSPEHARAVWAANAEGRHIPLPSWTRGEKLNVGTTFIDLFIQSSGLVETYLLPVGRNRWQYHLRLTPQARAWIEDRTEKQGILRPLYLPTIEPPFPWKGTTGGGYGVDRLLPMPLVKRTYRAHVEALKAADLTTVTRALNAIQETPWQINGRLLDVMTEAWSRGLLVDILPSAEDLPLPPKPLDIDTNEDARKSWQRQARDTYEQNAKSKAHRLEFQRLLALAEELRHQPALFFPHQLDFRGRCYAVPTGLNPQGPDEARSLLHFANGKPLGHTGMRWLAIHGANVFGFDKASMDDREAWAWDADNLARITASAADPLSNLWWTEADKPWSFLAWCFEWAEVIRREAESLIDETHGPKDFVSRIPIALDGTCNGLQHFSAMLRDPIGGAAVNLVASDKPQDIYQRVADRATELLREKEDWVSQTWVAFGIDRKITKRPVMVLPYGGTRISCMEYVRSAVRERIEGGQENPFGMEMLKATTALSSTIWAAIGDVVVAARSAMDWLQAAAREATKAGIACAWVTPSGFPAHQEYREMVARQIETRLRGSLIKPLDYGETDNLDRHKQANGIAPNFVHSMDAAALALTTCRALDAGITSFAMIHDSYGTTAADTEQLARCLREAFVAMYEEHDVLAEFRDGLLAACPSLKLPPLPPKGSLNIRDVLDSPYFFA